MFLDVVFSQARVGGKEQGPVRFRLALKRAEVRVKKDIEGILKIPPQSVVRESPTPMTRTYIYETERNAGGGGSAELSFSGIGGSLNLRGDGRVTVTDRLEASGPSQGLKVQHQRTDDGYAFVVKPLQGAWLDGEPWPALEPRMSILDTKHQRKRGFPPEVRVEIRCLREDLHIEDVKFTEKSGVSFDLLNRNKQMAVEQYIKDQLILIGLECGDLSDDFGELVLADATPET